MKKLLLLFAFFPCYVYASVDTFHIDKEILQTLYSVVSKKTAATDDVFRWAHRRIIYQVLGVDPAKSNDSIISSRIRFGWQQLQPVRISAADEPALYFKDVLRLALHHGYGPLLLDAVRWKVDVNSFDHTSHTSILDYLETEYRSGYDEKRLSWLREYKQVLLAGGANYFYEADFKMNNLAKKYDKIRPPVDGLYPVQRKGRWGWINANNKVVIPIKYKAVRFFTSEMFEVSDDGKRFFIIKKS